MMKGIGLVFLALCFSMHAMEQQTDALVAYVINEHKKFEQCRMELNDDLARFILDFSTWSQADKIKLQVIGQHFIIAGLSSKRQARYEHNLSTWINRHTTSQRQRENLIECIRYLQRM